MAKDEKNVLVLQGGGALGAYQAGAYETLAAADKDPEWVAGISIGAINAALICGNPPKKRVAALHAFWNEATSALSSAPWFSGAKSRALYSEWAAGAVMAWGVPGFFKPRMALEFFPVGQTRAASYYDTEPLRATLLELVDFDYLNTRGPRLSVGAVDIETANFVYFDSNEMKIGPEHIMASAALPPGFPPVEIDGRCYWDGGLVSNTPLQYVMDNLEHDPVAIFQVDLFSARGNLPEGLTDVTQREKDIRYSSRTRLTTDRYRQLHDLRMAAKRLAGKLPDNLKNDRDIELLQNSGPDCPITLVQLIHRKQSFEGSTKDYEFSRLSMTQHWAEGCEDTERTLSHRKWKSRKIAEEGLQVFDLGGNPCLTSVPEETVL